MCLLWPFAQGLPATPALCHMFLSWHSHKTTSDYSEEKGARLLRSALPYQYLVIFACLKSLLLYCLPSYNTTAMIFWHYHILVVFVHVKLMTNGSSLWWINILEKRDCSPSAYNYQEEPTQQPTVLYAWVDRFGLVFVLSMLMYQVLFVRFGW